MAAVKVSTKPPPPSFQLAGRRQCVVCGEGGMPSGPGSSVCFACVSDPDVARERVGRRRRTVLRNLENATSAYDNARDLLSDEEREKWDRYCALRLAIRRDGRWTESATAEQCRRFINTTEALKAPSHPKITEGLRRVYHADEGLYWAQEGSVEQLRRADVAEAQLDEALAGLARAAQDAAGEEPSYHPLYTLGYSGWTPEQVAHAVTSRGAILLDIRFAPWSKTPQWQQASLQRLLGSAYRHVKALGNVNYKGDGPITIADPEAGVEVVRRALLERPVILMCGCRDYWTCHRDEAADLVAQRLGLGPTDHLSPPKKGATQ